MTLEVNQPLLAFVDARCLRLRLCGMKRLEQLAGMI